MMACVWRSETARLAALAAAALVLAGPSPVGGQEPGPDSVVVLFNKADPESEALAKYYAERRGIEAERLIGVDAPAAEEISRLEFDSKIAAPFRATMLARGLWREEAASGRIIATRVRFLAIMRGIPLKIAHDESILPMAQQAPPIGTRNDASLDSELMALAIPGAGPAGAVPNPYFRRFLRATDLSAQPEILLAARVDAPDLLTARAMIDDAILAEREGLWGWAVVDSRGLTTGGMAEGDDWLRAAASAMRRAGIPVLMDSSEETLPEGFPLPRTAVYYGWYAGQVNGPFADPALRLAPGAIAVHIHSFSAASLRTVVGGWAGPLLARGAAASLGNVYEPYLSLTPDLGIFQDRLMAGFTLAESAWMATKAISWMNVVIGDPLYRPYAAWHRLGATFDNVFARYREIVRGAGGDVVAAEKSLRAAAKATGDSLFLEALAAAKLDAGDKAGALRALQDAQAVEKRKPERFRLGLEEYAILRASGDTRGAGRVLSRLAAEEWPPASRQLLATLYEHMNPTPPPTPKMR